MVMTRVLVEAADGFPFTCHPKPETEPEPDPDRNRSHHPNVNPKVNPNS